ncbi:MAG: hypothetical protein WC799_07130 [Desulfobacteraceae bacterium]|jgi:hypothetical protein
MTTFGKGFLKTLLIVLMLCVIGCDESSDTHNDEPIRALSTRTTAVEGDVSALQTEMDGKLDISGGTMTGNLTVPGIVYSTPKTHTACISGDMFRPRVSTHGYSSGLGGGGATITTPTTPPGVLMAQVNLPDGASITGITYYIYDNDATNDLKIYSSAHFFSGFYGPLHSVDAIVSTGASTSVQILSVVPTDNTTVVNTDRAYVLLAVPATGSVWSTNLLIRGVSFTYTLNEAP